MLIPNANRAVVDRTKLVDYCLDLTHPRGRHKARLFRTSLGLGPENALLLQTALVDAVRTIDAALGEFDSYGQRYIVDFKMTRPAGTAIIRSAWIVRTGEDFPRLATCYVV